MKDKIRILIGFYFYIFSLVNVHAPTNTHTTQVPSHQSNNRKLIRGCLCGEGDTLALSYHKWIGHMGFIQRPPKRKKKKKNLHLL